MSGIEVAGLVLGTLPILFEAVDLYRVNISKGKDILRRRVVVRNLENALLLQQQTLVETVRSVLIKSGCEDAWRLDDDPVAILNDELVGEQILDYLGRTNYATFNWALRQSYDCVQRITRVLSGLVPAMKGPSDDLLEVIKANKDADRKQLDLLPRARLLFNGTQLKEAIRDLDDNTESFRRFADAVMSNRQPVEQTSSRQAVKMGKAFRKVRSFAMDLHRAILQAWKSGCHDNHEAKFFLEDRVDTAVNLQKQSKKESQSKLTFNLIFVASTTDEDLWHEAPVHVPDELIYSGSDQDQGLNDVNSKTSRVKIIAPEKTVKLTARSIDDMCAVMRSVGARSRGIALVLTEDQKMGTCTVAANNLALLPCSKAEKLTLKTILSTSESSRSALLPLRCRMTLALRLATNLLQLVQTHWLKEPLSKEMICFFLLSNIEGHPNVDLNRPFVSHPFHSSVKDTQPQRTVDPKIVLLELGILLLEIWHNKTVESQFSLPDSPRAYRERLALALEWLDDLSDQPPELYDKAVCHCIRGIVGGETRLSDWEDPQLWSAVCQDVIEPLYKNCKQWR